MTNNRLSTIAADLAERLEHQPPAKLREVAAIAALLAIERTNLTDPRLDACRIALRDRIPGDQAARSAVQEMTVELDEVAWNAQDAAAQGSHDTDTYLRAFKRARAAAAVGFALEPDVLHAALESVYEAQAAVNDIDAVRSAVQHALPDSD